METELIRNNIYVRNSSYTEFIKDLERLALKHLKEDGRKKAFEEEVHS